MIRNIIAWTVAATIGWSESSIRDSAIAAISACVIVRNSSNLLIRIYSGLVCVACRSRSIVCRVPLSPALFCVLVLLRYVLLPFVIVGDLCIEYGTCLVDGSCAVRYAYCGPVGG